jgi:hypothetical protein
MLPLAPLLLMKFMTPSEPLNAFSLPDEWLQLTGKNSVGVSEPLLQADQSPGNSFAR